MLQVTRFLCIFVMHSSDGHKNRLILFDNQLLASEDLLVIVTIGQLRLEPHLLSCSFIFSLLEFKLDQFRLYIETYRKLKGNMFG